MKKLTLSTQTGSTATTISNNFIDNFMPGANGEFIKIYIYLLRCVTSNAGNISISSLADVFNQTEADVVRALRYWDKTGAISLVFDKSSSEISGITFCDLDSAQYNTESAVDYTVISNTAQNNAPAIYDNITDFKNPSRTINALGTTGTAYTPAQIASLRSQDEFKALIFALGNYLGHTLTPSETSTFAYLYDTLNFSTELIEYLVEYCTSKKKKSIRYIEKVALSWADEGITNVKEARAANSNHNDAIYLVLNAFGITNRNAGQLERDYILKWTDTYGFDNEIILEACNRTLRITHQPSFEYADSILTKWQLANVKTTDDIKKIDAEYAQGQQKGYAKRSATPPKAANRFNNFTQRDIDIDSLESSLISNNG